MSKIITDINQLDMDKTYSYADYLLWNFKERIELFRGKIFKMSPAPSRKHQVVSWNLIREIDAIFRKTKCGMFSAPFDVRLVNFEKSTADHKVFTVVQPDICVVCDQSKLDDRGCIGSPDLVIEILSPGNSKKEMGIKFNLYQENLVKEYWIVEPAENCVYVYTFQNDRYIGLKPCIEGEKITSPLFPALQFDIENIFVE